MLYWKLIKERSLRKLVLPFAIILLLAIILIITVFTLSSSPNTDQAENQYVQALEDSSPESEKSESKLDTSGAILNSNSHSNDNEPIQGSQSFASNKNGKIEVSILAECKAAYKSSPDFVSTFSNKGVLQKEKKLSLSGDATVEAALKDSGLNYTAEYGYVNSIEKLNAGALGKKSAWFYSVNGKFPTDSFNQYHLKDGDRIAWHYSINSGKDIGLQKVSPLSFQTKEGEGGTESEEGGEDGEDSGDDEGDDEEPIEEEVSLSGTILDNLGEPIEGITVIAWVYDEEEEIWTEKTSIYSDDDGNYQFVDFEEGKYKLEYFDEPLNYLRQYWQNKETFDEADQILFTPDSPIENLDITLINSISLSGKVTDSTSSAISNIDVSLYKLENNIWQKLTTLASAHDGNYNFHSLKSGQYTLGVSDPQNRYFPYFWESAEDLNAADAIELNAGDAHILDFTLQRCIVLTGKVEDFEGSGLSNISLSAINLSNQGATKALTAQDGSFFLRLLQGQYKLLINDSEDVSFNSNYEISYYPDSPNISGAETLTLNTSIFSLNITVTSPPANTYSQKTLKFFSTYGQVPEQRVLDYSQAIGTLPDLRLINTMDLTMRLNLLLLNMDVQML